MRSGARCAALLLLPWTSIAAQQSTSRGITDVPGLRVGHHTLTERPTGCTVVLLDSAGAVGGVAQRGGAPGTRETDLLDPTNTVDRVNAVVLSGGSAFGLDAAQGVVRWLDERNIGYRTRVATVPIVPAAVIFDLQVGSNPRIRPTADCGYRAASSAAAGAIAEGNVGAGAGATVGKIGAFLGGPARSAMKGGVGTASITLPSGLVVGAIVVVNAAGDVIDPHTGRVVAGVRNADGTLADVRALLRTGGAMSPRPGENTTIGIVATNARLSKAQATRVASMADDGLARAIVPSHTEGDGDTMFALATGTWSGDASVTLVGALAAEVVAEAIVRAVSRAESVAGYASARETGTIPPRLR